MATTASFQAFKFSKQVLQALEATGYTTPTPIQQKAIPLILGGNDVLGIAQTGTGKTAAYLLPLLVQLKYAQGTHPRALVLATSKELVIQIAAHWATLASYTNLRCACLYGGVGKSAQIETLRQGVDLVVATPGRLLDLYRQGSLYLRQVKHLVLDEADKLLAMGFEAQLRSLFELLPGKRQHLLFSATMSAQVLQLAEEFLAWPEKAIVTPQATPAATVSQQCYYVPNVATKARLLAWLLADTTAFHKVIVFTKTRKTATEIAHFLQRKAVGSVRVIHANKGQNTRLNALNAFRAGAVRILIATDVAARGIDVSQVSQVISFDVPTAPEEYVHRMGRTGRAAHTGQAITLANEAEAYYVRQIEQLIGQRIPVFPLPDALEVTPAPQEEQQALLRALDWQRQKEDPSYQGAFHKKKAKKMRPKVRPQRAPGAVSSGKHKK
ncbi:MAG: DEAD/DEAH box helicase [Roseivirga sp.]